MSKVLVLDGQTIASLAVVRSLANHGVEITCGEENRNSLAFYSKYVKDTIIYPSPEKQPNSFIEYIMDVLIENNYDFVVPVSDHSTKLISKHKKELSKYTNVPVPKYEIFEMGINKEKTFQNAIGNSIPCPQTFFPNENNLREIFDCINYPIIIKPVYSSGARGIVRVDSRKTASESYEFVYKNYGKAIIQEYIPSKQGRYLVQAVFNKNSIPICACVIQSLRCYPISVGPTAAGITVSNNEIIEYSFKLLKGIGWQGVAEVEFLVDQRDNKPKLMELNPRFGNPTGLSIAAGVDIPYILYDIWVNKKEDKINYEFKKNIKWRWLLPQDFLWFLNAPQKANNLKHFLKFKDDNLHYAIISLKDPGPIIGTILQSVRFLKNKELREIIFKRGV